MWRSQGYLYSVSCHLQIVRVLPLPFQFVNLLFPFFVRLLWLGLPILCWIEVVRVDILVLFLNLVGRLSAVHPWVLCWLWICHKRLLLCWYMFPLYPLWGEFFSGRDVEFFQMLFLHLFRWSCGFTFTFVNVVYIDWFAYVEPSLHPWNESNLIMVYDAFHALLDLVC